MFGSNIVSYKFSENSLNEEEINIPKNIIDQKIFKEKIKCQNCGLKFKRNYFKIYIIDKEEELIDSNLILLCNDCFEVLESEKNPKNSILIKLPRNRLDHLSQAQIIYYLRYLYVIKYKMNEKEKTFSKKVPFRTFSLFQQTIIEDIIEETEEYFEDILTNVDEDDIADEDKDHKNLKYPDRLFNFIKKYLLEEEDTIEDLESNIIVLPLFENTIFKDELNILALYNNLRIDNIKNDFISFLNNNKKIFDNIDKIIEFLNKN